MMFNASAVMSCNVILLLSAIVCYDILWNEMIFSLICINSQPISNVIIVYYETHMMILKWTEYNMMVISYYFYFLFFSPQRVEERWKESCVTMHCDEVHVTVICDMWINALWNCHHCFLSLYQNPMALLMCFSPTHANLAQWSGWNDPQCTWGNYWMSIVTEFSYSELQVHEICLPTCDRLFLDTSFPRYSSTIVGVVLMCLLVLLMLCNILLYRVIFANIMV